MKHHDITSHIESATPTLTNEERHVMWSAVSKHLPVPSPITITPSPFLFRFTHYKPMTALILTLLLIVGGGGTALASDAARPGDLLYPLERAIENTRFHLTMSDEGRVALTRALTEERLLELREIIDEETVVVPTNVTDRDFSLAGTIGMQATITLAISADVFTDTTVVKVELNDSVLYLETSEKTREGIMSVLGEKFPTLTREALEAAFSFEVEDRASRPKDRGIVSVTPRGHERVSTAMQAILEFLDTTTDPSDTSRDEALTAVMGEIDDSVNVAHDKNEVRVDKGDHRYEIRLRDDGENRIEVRNGGTRVRIEEKDGEVRVRTEEKGDDRLSPVMLPPVDTQVPNPFASLEIEAEVYTDITRIQVEYQGDKVTFESSADSRAEIIRAVHEKFPALTEEAIDNTLFMETEDRSYRDDEDVVEDASDASPMDDSDDGRDDDDDDRGRDEDEEEEDDGRGHNEGGNEEDEEDDEED